MKGTASEVSAYIYTRCTGALRAPLDLSPCKCKGCCMGALRTFLDLGKKLQER